MCGGTGLATQHWSGKLEGCAYHNQHAEHAVARGFGSMPPEIFIKLHALRLNLRGNSYISCTHNIAICSLVIISTNVAIGSHLLTQITW